MKYVAWSVERLRDGEEESAKITNSKEDALIWINKLRQGYAGCNREFALFELGKQIPLGVERTSIPQAPVEIEKIVLREGK